MGRRPEMRIGVEFEFDQIFSPFSIFKDQGVRQRLQQPLTSPLILIFILAVIFSALQDY